MDTKKLIEHSKSYIKHLGESVDHLLITAESVKEIDSKATDSMIIACLLHDIERAFKEDRTPPGDSNDICNVGYQLWHGKRSADFASIFLNENGASEDLINEVYSMIEKHEVGGTDIQNLIKDADSLSFLQTQIGIFLDFVPARFSREEVKEKFDWMFDRISSDKARSLAKPFYIEALNKLSDSEK